MLVEAYRTASIVKELLSQMDEYDWSSVDDIPADRFEYRSNLNTLEERTEFLGTKQVGPTLHFDARQILRHSGINLNGSILEFDAGLSSIGDAYPDYVAIDDDPRNVKYLRRMGIRAIVGTVEELPLPQNSFDYVLAFSPLIVRETKGWRRVNGEWSDVEVTSDYKEEIVGRAIKIAKKKALIASIPIALDPPFMEKAEKIVADPRHRFYYVLYEGR